ncbi:MAG: hypothetical protein HQ518_01780 [Rhodopirellula sp.]|nr:hypothetical protein [Rhodopirellula sp.]
MRVLRNVAALVLMFAVSGCAAMQPVQEMTQYMKTSLRPHGLDYQMGGDEATGEWDQVGIEGRGDKPRVSENDPFRKYLMSPRAREIEANLGIGD